MGFAASFTNNSSSVSYSTNVYLSNLNNFTLLSWITPRNSIASQRGVVCRDNILRKNLEINTNGPGCFGCYIEAATTNGFAWSANNVISIGTTCMLACTYNNSTKSAPLLYLGSLTSSPLLMAPVLSSNVSGNLLDDSSCPLLIGAIDFTSGGEDKDINWVIIWNRVLSINEIKKVWNITKLNPHPRIARGLLPSGCRFLTRLGEDFRVMDYSGYGGHSSSNPAFTRTNGMATRWPIRKVARTWYDVIFDTTSNSTYQTAQSTYSWSHTCSGINRFLTVDVEMLSVPGTTVTSITYNGISLSLIGAKSTVSGAGRVECWGLTNPSSGTNTISITLSASIASCGTAVSYSNVDQVTPTEGFVSAQATNIGAVDATVTVSTTGDRDWIHAACVTDDTSITALQTSRNNVTGVLGSGANEDIAVISPAGSQIMSYTNIGAAATWAIAAYAIRSSFIQPYYTISNIFHSQAIQRASSF